MSVLLLVLVILAIFFQSIMQKQYNRSTNNQGTFIFNVVTFLSAAVVFFITDTDGFMMDKALLPYILGLALCFATAMLFIFLAIREGALSLTCLLKSYSLLLPTFYSVLFLDETVGLLFWLGLVFFVISIFFINIKKEDTKFSFKWCIYVVLMVISNGSASTVQMLQQKRFAGQYKSEFMACAILIGAVFFLILSFAKEKHIMKSCLKQGSVYMVLMGVLVALANLFLMMVISSDIPTPIIYPVMSGGGVILATLVSVIFYKERLSFLQWLGLASGVVSIVLMNLN